MKLTKENVYIDLRGKSKEELTELYNFLESVGEKQFRDSLNDFLDNCSNSWIAYELSISNNWVLSSNEHSLSKKTEVTLLQLIEILKPMNLTLEQQLKKAEAEVKRLKEAIEDSKIKVGDWCKFWDDYKNEFVIGKLQTNICSIYTTSGKNFRNCEKITDLSLLKRLNKLL